MKQKKKPKQKRKRPASVGISNTQRKEEARRKYHNQWRGWTNKGYPTAKKSKGFKAEKPYPFPSHYGSHSSMVVGPVSVRTETGWEEWLLLRDEYGEYLTTQDRIDTGLADPRRYEGERMAG